MQLTLIWVFPAACSVEIPTRDARSSIRFTVVPTGPASQAIVVEAVADSSSAAEAGIQRGMKLAAISDPVRRNEVWELQVSQAGGCGFCGSWPVFCGPVFPIRVRPPVRVAVGNRSQRGGQARRNQ